MHCHSKNLKEKIHLDIKDHATLYRNNYRTLENVCVKKIEFKTFMKFKDI